MDDSGQHTPRAGSDRRDAVETDGVGSSPLRPDERETFGTDVAAGDGSDDRDGLSPAREPRTWFAIGPFLFLVFVGILVWAVLQPLFL